MNFKKLRVSGLREKSVPLLFALFKLVNPISSVILQESLFFFVGREGGRELRLKLANNPRQLNRFYIKAYFLIS